MTTGGRRPSRLVRGATKQRQGQGPPLLRPCKLKLLHIECFSRSLSGGGKELSAERRSRPPTVELP
jgi:hypothetical protein